MEEDLIEKPDGGSAAEPAEGPEAPKDDPLFDTLCADLGIERQWASPQQLAKARLSLAFARAWLHGAVGIAAAEADPRADVLVAMAAEEAFDSMGVTDANLSKYAGAKVTASLNRLAFDVLQQLRTEYADAEE